MATRADQIIVRLLGPLRISYRSKLAWGVTGAVFASLLLIELIILIPSFYRHRDDQVRALESTILASLQPMVSILGETAPVETRDRQDFYRHFLVHPDLKGMAVYTSAGESLASFGEPPRLHWKDLSLTGRTDLADWSNHRIELAWGKELLKKDLVVVTRLDTTAIQTEGRRYLWRVLGLVFLISIVVTASTMWVLSSFILSPILTLHQRLRAAARNPENAPIVLMSPRGSDELSELVQAFNDLVHQVAANIAELKAREREAVLRQEELNEAHRNLHLAHSETQQLIASIPSVLIVLDSQFHITRWNDFAAQLFGHDSDYALGKDFFSLNVLCDSQRIRAGLDSCKSSQTQITLGELRCRLPNDRDRFLSVSILPLSSDSHENFGYLLVAQDFTERKLIEQQLNQAQKLEAIGQLAAGIAHEINTPIQYVGDNLCFLSDAFRDLWRLLEVFQHLETECRSGRSLTASLEELQKLTDEIELSYLKKEIPDAIRQGLEGTSRVSHIVPAMKKFSHPGTVDKIMIDLNEAIRSTVTVSRSEWKYVARLEMDLDPNLPPVRCFPAELNQAILNILVNAAHAIGDTVLNGELGLISVRTRQIEDQVEIRISDTGCGIPEEIRSRVFDPFFTTKEVGKGTGQRLCIAYSVIVEKHGGSIHFETEVQKGTTFIIRLPLDPDADMAASAWNQSTKVN